MAVELSITNCGSLGLLARQPNVGFALFSSEGRYQYVTQFAKRLLFGRVSYDPTGLSLQTVEGPDVGLEMADVVAKVCASQSQIEYEQVRFGRLMNWSFWPIHGDPAAGSLPPDSAIAMMTYARDTAQASILDRLQLTQQRPIEANATERGSICSEFAHWGRLSELTAREREVLVWIGRGLSQREIGEQLKVSAKTVETHRMRLGKKLNVVNGAELVRIACYGGFGPEHVHRKPQRGAAWFDGEDEAASQ